MPTSCRFSLPARPVPTSGHPLPDPPALSACLARCLAHLPRPLALPACLPCPLASPVCPAASDPAFPAHASRRPALPCRSHPDPVRPSRPRSSGSGLPSSCRPPVHQVRGSLRLPFPMSAVVATVPPARPSMSARPGLDWWRVRAFRPACHARRSLGPGPAPSEGLR